MSDHLKGVVQSGTGRGAKFISLPIYSNIFESFLGATPFYGTLNLELDEKSAKIVNERFSNGQVFDNLTYNGKSFGAIVVIPIDLNSEDLNASAVAVRPHLTTHDSNIVELVSDKHLREKLNLRDGDIVKFSI